MSREGARPPLPDGRRPRLDEAEPDLTEALRFYQSEPNPDPGLLASVHNSLGNLFLARGDLARAEDEHRRSVELRQSWAFSNPHRLQSLHDLGRTLVRRGKLDEAESILGEVLAGRERMLGPEHPATGFTLAALGELEVARRRPEAARAYFARAARIFTAKLREDHPAFAALRRELAELDAPAATK